MEREREREGGKEEGLMNEEKRLGGEGRGAAGEFKLTLSIS